MLICAKNNKKFVKGVINITMLIESFENDRIEDLSAKLPKESFIIVKPKHFDGSEVIQIFIDIAKVVGPAAVTALSTYLIAAKNSSSVKIKFNVGDKIECEIQGKINDKQLQENELYHELIKVINKNIKEDDNCGIDNR